MTYDELIYNTARADGMPDKLALFIVAQARHETGNYSSDFFTIGKNAFGYSFVSGAKWQLSTPGPMADNGEPIAQYSSVERSVHEITDWIKRRQNEGKFPASLSTIQTPEYYAQLLKQSGYFGAPLQTYTAALIGWLQQISHNLFRPEGASVGLLIIFLLLMFNNKIFPK